MRERAATRAGFNQSRAGASSQPVQNVAVVWRIHDLGPMRKPCCPRLGGRRQDMNKPAGRRLERITSKCFVCLALAGLFGAAAVDVRGDYLRAPWLANQRAVRERAEAGCRDFVFFIVCMRFQNDWHQVVSAQMQDGQLVGGGRGRGVEEGRGHVEPGM